MQTDTHTARVANTDDDPYRDVAGQAARIDSNPATIRRMIKAGVLRHARVGVGRKHIRIRDSWMDAAVEGLATPREASGT